MSQTPLNTSDFKILLVENSRTARAVLTRGLQAEGCSVETVATGLEAIDALFKSDFHLVIMDVFLPQMNGYEAAHNIRAIESNKSNIPIIALSSSTNEKDKDACLAAGMNDYVVKSEDNAALFSVIEKYKQQHLTQGKRAHPNRAS